MERDINFSLLLTILKKSWWKIIIIALAVMLVVASYTHFLIPKKYTSSVRFYILNINATQDNTTTQLLGAAAQLTKDYMDIITSEYMLTMVSEALQEKGYENVPISALQSMIRYSAKAESSVFTLSVVHTNPQVAYDVACVIRDIAPEAVTAKARPDSITHEGLGEKIYIFLQYYDKNYAPDEASKTNLTKGEIINMLRNDFQGVLGKVNCIEPLDSPKLASTHSSPNLVSNVMLSGAIAVVGMYIFFLLRAILEQNITSEEDLKRMLGKPVIGAIPHWESAAKK